MIEGNYISLVKRYWALCMKPHTVLSAVQGSSFIPHAPSILKIKKLLSHTAMHSYDTRML